MHKFMSTFLVAELLNSGFLLPFFLLLNGLELKILVVDLLDLLHVLDFLFPALSLFFLLLADGLLGFQSDEFTFIKFLSHLLNVFLLHLFVLLSYSLLELFKFFFLQFFFFLLFFLFFLQLFLQLINKLPKSIHDKTVHAFFRYHPSTFLSQSGPISQPVYQTSTAYCSRHVLFHCSWTAFNSPVAALLALIFIDIDALTRQFFFVKVTIFRTFWIFTTLFAFLDLWDCQPIFQF